MVVGGTGRARRRSGSCGRRRPWPGSCRRARRGRCRAGAKGCPTAVDHGTEPGRPAVRALGRSRVRAAHSGPGWHSYRHVPGSGVGRHHAVRGRRRPSARRAAAAVAVALPRAQRAHVHNHRRPARIWFFSLPTRQASPSSPARASRTSCPTASPRWALPAPAAASPTAAAPAPRAPSCAWPTSPRDRRPTRRPARSEHFLTERYCLYTVDRDDRLRRADIHHAPWPLQPARADLAENTMTAALGIRLRTRSRSCTFPRDKMYSCGRSLQPHQGSDPGGSGARLEPLREPRRRIADARCSRARPCGESTRQAHVRPPNPSPGGNDGRSTARRDRGPRA
jgi:hypothetical protein